MIHTLIGDFGHLFVIISFVTALVATISYYKVTTQSNELLKKDWGKFARTFFYLHTVSVWAVVAILFTIIYNHYFEYYYAWEHSSRNLPVHYMISCFWEGQEGSFLLWIFWNTILGIILIRTNKKWEGPMMTIFALVQAFLVSMILGTVIPGLEVKIGSDPFILLRDGLEAPIFKMNPNFVPKDGTGLNPLLQNYWMVIHPPTLFLGFALTLVPFAYLIAGLWTNQYKEWIRPAFPWSLTAALILGIGIMMGAYWAYETLNFGGYWNWDPVENAVYIPWLVLVASIHTMIIFRKNNTALKSSIILTLSTFILVLYSTFLTRSGILGEASVHSFTDLGLSEQLLVYLVAFIVISMVLCIKVWKKLPTNKEEVSTYSREFWIFMGATTLCLMSFQVLIPTSIPVYNGIIELFGGISNAAPPADQIEFYSKFQLWFAISLALLSGTGQLFWWKKMDKEQLKAAIALPFVLTLLISSIVVLISGVHHVTYILLLVASIYTIIANLKVLFNVLKSNYKLSGGAITHIGMAMMLIGILFSAGYSNIISLNTTGLGYSNDFDDEVNLKNLLLFINEPNQMDKYEVTYKGQRLEVKGVPGYVPKGLFRLTDDPYKITAKEAIVIDGITYAQRGDTLSISPENTYYEVEFKEANGNVIYLYPRLQVNEQMGNIVSPAIKKDLFRDIYMHPTVVAPDVTSEKDWSDPEEKELKAGEQFFVNDYVANFEGVHRIHDVEGVDLGPNDVAVQATIKIQGENQNYTVRPVYLIKDKMVGRLSDEADDLAVKLSLLNVHPERDSFTLGIQTTQKDYIIVKAMEKPLINLLWLGTIILSIGFTMAIHRRYSEFKKMREKGMA
ncbi:heme lyase CcmF/NrfE family subunit [Xanthovirga aplysinae]|uniref:heme lyase CcmF/NrfE family subunit n=1 Tax=Xanthovirga aplysinae TaxID=2529853 RepID=UPI0012BBC546|nr:cytochrome c biogenesis protein CcsA [Xanthovirga aplysinae]MTI33632.1 cytochrome C biogenesis protein [Xanthovirga aplysinae]